ncbi:hypothetical protein F5888DRAFT_1113761 [Russula emetica]|nr:hypothetical protein F5888DRAFT_1113761 [Russula emetica]
MAAVLAPSSVHSSSHLLAAHRDTFAAFHQHRGLAPASHSPRKEFDAFAARHHSSAKSRSEAASWRQSEPQAVVRQPAPVRTPSPKSRRSGLSHSRTPSTSSEASSTSWRSHDRSQAAATQAAATRADVTEEPSGPQLKASSPFVYSAAELLRLSASPLVGISKESQDVVDELVAHYVWRRGTQSGSPRTSRRRRNKRGTSKPQSLHTSTDDSEHSD